MTVLTDKCKDLTLAQEIIITNLAMDSVARVDRAWYVAITKREDGEWTVGEFRATSKCLAEWINFQDHPELFTPAVGFKKEGSVWYVNTEAWKAPVIESDPMPEKPRPGMRGKGWNRYQKKIILHLIAVLNAALFCNLDTELEVVPCNDLFKSAVVLAKKLPRDAVEHACRQCNNADDAVAVMKDNRVLLNDWELEESDNDV